MRPSLVFYKKASWANVKATSTAALPPPPADRHRLNGAASAGAAGLTGLRAVADEHEPWPALQTTAQRGGCLFRVCVSVAAGRCSSADAATVDALVVRASDVVATGAAVDVAVAGAQCQWDTAQRGKNPDDKLAASTVSVVVLGAASAQAADGSPVVSAARAGVVSASSITLRRRQGL